MNLRDFQIEALEQLNGRSRCAFYYGLGLGKTFMGAEKLVRGSCRHILVVCQKSKIQDWTAHFLEHYPELAVFNLRKKKDKDAFICQDTNGRKVGIINYDMLAKLGPQLPGRSLGVIYDESSMIKNPGAGRTRAAMRLDVDELVLLSGTPVGGKYEELWSQARMLGWDITLKDFYDRYIITTIIDRPGIPAFVKVIGYKNVAELKRNMRNHGALFKQTDEVLTLPDEVDTVISVAAPKPYYDLVRKGVAVINGEVRVPNSSLEKLMMLRQLSSPWNPAKTDALSDLVNSTSDRLIVFYNFTEEMEHVKEIARKAGRPFGYVNGYGVSLEPYQQHADSITAIQYQAGAMGLNMQKANKMVFLSPPLSYELYAQARGRIRRMGQDRTCFYWRLICDDLESRVYRALARREDYTARLFDNGW